MAAPRLTVLLCLWRGWRPVYEIAHVNAMSRMLKEYLRIPYRLFLLTDQDSGGAEVDAVMPLPADPRHLRVVRSSAPNCFRRLRFFDPEYGKQFGTEWLMSIDLDTLIRADITDLVSKAMDHPFGLWILRGRHAGEKATERPYNGALYMVRVGSHPQVWETFDPVESPRQIERVKWVGSDQSWIGLTAPGAPTFGREHGVYFLGQYPTHRLKNKAYAAPRIINYAGGDKPWNKRVKFKQPSLYVDYARWLDSAEPADKAQSA